jgi:exonuclease SbcC
MRPVLLDMDGFASFRDQATVDFTDADYFALVGPTGSGKSTVIDAMIFALYGTVPRWQDRRMVMYALAPTAVRGTVRLVFDVEHQRYVVARELRRAKAGGVNIKSGRLERLLDPTTIGTINDPTEVIAADGLVTAAVEKLLGLSFEHFCQCVVLPQGEFAEFLRAKGSDRREILLKLLGAGLYKEIAQSANSRAALAGHRATLLAEQLIGFFDATPQMEALAAEREEALRVLTENVDLAVPRLRAATDAVTQAERALADLTAEHQLLTSVRLPDGVSDLDTAVTAQHVALQQAKDAERSAQTADATARDALAAAPDRGPLEQARREHAEQRRILAEVPSARTDVEAAATRLEQARQQSTAAGEAVDTSRNARDAAAVDAAAAGSLVARLTAEAESLAAVALPPGLAELDDRIRNADGALTESAERLAAAERTDAAARAAVRNAPPRGPLELTLRQVADLAAATTAVEQIRQRAQLAARDLERTNAALKAAATALDKARAARDRAAVAGGAAALRQHLVAGEACPVCEQVVTTLPPPAHAPKLTAADKAVAAAEAKVQKARAEDLQAAQLVAAVDAQLSAATERVTALQTALAGQPTDETVIREALNELDRLDAQARAADEAVQQVRAESAAAQAAVRQAEADAAALRRSLQQARDPLVALGAPGVDGAQLLASWTQLTDWAAAQSDSRRQALVAAHAADDAAEAALRLAEKSLADTQTRAEQARKGETEATASHERVKAALKGLQTRLGELTASLFDAPSDLEAQEQLARIDELTAAVRNADAALRAARSSREQAEDSARALDRQVAVAWQGLRKVRDGLIALGAPELPDGSVLSGWNALFEWSAEQAGIRAAALPTAQAAAVTSTRHRDEIVTLLEIEFDALDVLLAPGEITSTAPVAAATALSQARAERARTIERREQAARLTVEHAAAESEQQVANMLGNLLRSNQFPEWLEAAALDTLVADASVRLAELSNGQFELTHRNGEFFVIDHADADSQRGVRTLSGGETFQASLALALALSTQLSSMAAAGAARLDSIFLDEGFGTLDESTLEIVAATLESLAQGDRMVGVVTHVAALAERVPVRFVVNRDSRTSSISRESA